MYSETRVSIIQLLGKGIVNTMNVPKKINKYTKLEIWGFAVTILAALFSVFTWWEGGLNGEVELTVQERQNNLLSDLIEKTSKTNSTLDAILGLSKEQLRVSGELTKLGEIVSLIGSSGSQEEKASKVADLVLEGRAKVESIVDKSELNLRKPISDKIGKIGWIYIGKFINKQGKWNNKTVDLEQNVNIGDGNRVSITTEVGFNEAKPHFPLYERGLNRIFPYALVVNTEVEVLELDPEVGMRDFTWAKVKIVNAPE